MKILIIRFSSIGDVVLTTSLISAIKDIQNDAEINVLTKNEYKDILKYNKDINELLILEKGNLFKTINYINKKNIDVIIDLHNNLRSNLIKMLCGAKIKTTYRKNIFNRRVLVLKAFFNRMFGKNNDAYKLRIIKNTELKQIEHVSNKYFKCLKSVFDKKDISGLCRQYKTNISMPHIETSKNTFVIGFNPGGKNLTKRLCVDKYVELAKKIIDKFDAKIILFGDKNDIELGNYIQEKFGSSPNIVNMIGKTDLLELCGLIAKCKLFITGDTGPMHISNAFDVPVISIFGPTVVEFGFYPTGVNDVVLCLDMNCRPCSLHGGNKCPIGTHNCMKQINVDDIFKIICDKI